MEKTQLDSNLYCKSDIAIYIRDYEPFVDKDNTSRCKCSEGISWYIFIR